MGLIKIQTICQCDSFNWSAFQLHHRRPHNFKSYHFGCVCCWYREYTRNPIRTAPIWRSSAIKVLPYRTVATHHSEIISSHCFPFASLILLFSHTPSLLRATHSDADKRLELCGSDRSSSRRKAGAYNTLTSFLISIIQHIFIFVHA